MTPVLFCILVELFLIEGICPKWTVAYFDSEAMGHYNFFLEHFFSYCLIPTTTEYIFFKTNFCSKALYFMGTVAQW